jgi:DNA polymerase-1
MMTNPILILDAHYLCYRGKYTTGHLSYREDRTGVVYAFLRDIATFSEVFMPRAWAFCFDSPTSIRKTIYPEYKAARSKTREQLSQDEILEVAAFRKQVAALRDSYLPRLGFSNVFETEGIEADDIIARLCGKYHKKNQIVVVSADKDLFQCLRPHVSVWNPTTRHMMTMASFMKEYGIKPSQWAEAKAIAGCSSDGVPGIDRVGEKTAIKYIKKLLNTSSDAFLNIRAGKEIIERNRKLVTLPIPNDQPMPVLRTDHFNSQEWVRLCDELGIRRLPFYGTKAN